MSRYHLPPIVRGSRWSFLVGMEIADFDWTDVTVACQLRARDGRLIYDLAATDHVFTSIESGEFRVLLDVPGTVTAAWSGLLLGDIKISRGSPSFGPYTPVEFQFEVRTGTTR